MPHQFQFRLIPGINAFLFSLCTIILMNFNTGFAQSSKPSAGADTTKTAKVIEPIALSTIGTETEVVLSKVREIRSKLKPSKSEIEIDSLIPVKLEAFNLKKKELDLEEIARMNLRQTESLKNDFNQMKNQLDGWRNSFVQKSEEMTKMKLELSEFKKRWEITLTQEREEKLPQQVTERIQSNLKEVNILDKELTDRNNGLLTKQDGLTEAIVFIDKVLSIINNTEEILRTQIFRIDSPPIWHLFDSKRDSLFNESKEDTLTFSNRIDLVIEQQNVDFRGFKENYSANIYFHILFFVILFILISYLKNDVTSWSDEKKDEAIKSSLHIITKPFTAALLVSLLLTRLFYSEAPSDVYNYYYALMVWPILSIVPGLIPAIPKKYFYFVGAVFLLFQVADYFSDLVVLDRTLSLALDTITIALILSLRSSRNTIREAAPNIKWGFVFMLMRLTVVLLVVSVVANSLGNTVLSKILSQGSLVMIYGGIIIYASALILRGLFALLMQHEKVSQLNMIKTYPEEVKAKLFQMIRWGAVIYWVFISLSAFQIYEPIFTWISELISSERKIGSVSLSIGNFLAFFITLWISVLVSKFIRFILQDEILTHFDMPRGVPGAISMLVRLTLLTLGFVLAFGAAQIPFDNIAIIFGAMSVGIGFGLQNIFNNLVSGLILAFERPIQVGDVIQLNTLNLMGEVKEIGIRASTVRTFDGAEVIVPNGNLISNEMVNWTLSDHRKRQEILVGVKYGTDTNKVLEILNSVVPEQANVLKNPAPFNIFIGFGDSSLDFRVLFWTRFDVGMSTKSAVGIAIDEAFKKNDIEIPFPQRDLHLRSISDSVDINKDGKQKPAPSKKIAGAQATSEKKIKD